MQSGIRALAWKHDAVSRIDDGGVCGDANCFSRRNVLQRFGHRAQVTHSVIDYGYHCVCTRRCAAPVHTQ